MKVHHWIFLIIFSALFFALSLGSALNESFTYDEPLHVQEGINALTKHTFNIDPLNPPLVREILALPMALTASRGVFPLKFIVITCSIVLLFGVFFVTKTYIGMLPAMLSLVLFTFEPNLLAHSHYLTLDMGFTLFFFLAYVAFLEFMRVKTFRSALLFGFTFGLSLASKISAIAYMALSAVVYFPLCRSRAGGNPEFGSRVKPGMTIKIVGMTVVAFFVVWASYFFTTDVVIKEREDATRVSSRIIQFAKDKHVPLIAEIVTLGKTQKIPLGQYLALVKNTAIYARQPKPVFYLGEAYEKSRWYFMPVNILLKTPLQLLILFGIGLLDAVRRKKYKVLYFLPPILAILLFASISGISPWIRYVLPMYPCMIMVAASSVYVIRRPLGKLYLVILILWYIYGTMMQYPYFLSYANEILKPGKRYEAMYDVNIDWGEKLPSVREYIDRVGPKEVKLSYFGTDDGDRYGLKSDIPYETYKVVGICGFHTIRRDSKTDSGQVRMTKNGQGIMTIISVPNWYYCGYYKDPQYKENKIREVVEESFFVF